MVSGVLLVLMGFRRCAPTTLALGLLLATVKFQETWLLILALPVLLVRKWPASQWLRAGLTCVFLVGLSMILWGQAWIAAMFPGTSAAGSAGVGLTSEMGRGTLIDVTLRAALQRMGSCGLDSEYALVADPCRKCVHRCDLGKAL